MTRLLRIYEVDSFANARLPRRNIDIYSFSSPSPTRVEAVGGEAAAALPALPVFLHASHYQALARL